MRGAAARPIAGLQAVQCFAVGAPLDLSAEAGWRCNEAIFCHVTIPGVADKAYDRSSLFLDEKTSVSMQLAPLPA